MINIKESNKGKFTEQANDAGMGVQEFARHVLANKDDYNSTTIKRANFARNSLKWIHKAQEGGSINTDQIGEYQLVKEKDKVWIPTFNDVINYGDFTELDYSNVYKIPNSDFHRIHNYKPNNSDDRHDKYKYVPVFKNKYGILTSKKPDTGVRDPEILNQIYEYNKKVNLLSEKYKIKKVFPQTIKGKQYKIYKDLTGDIEPDNSIKEPIFIPQERSELFFDNFGGTYAPNAKYKGERYDGGYSLDDDYLFDKDVIVSNKFGGKTKLNKKIKI